MSDGGRRVVGQERRSRRHFLERPAVLGVDIGRVVTAEDPTAGVSLLSDSHWRNTEPSEGALEGLRLLTTHPLFDGRVYLVSKCGPKVEARTRAWFDIVGFFERTQINPEHVIFVRTREEKTPVCQRLGVTHFVDDRLDVLAGMSDAVRFRFLFRRTLPDQLPNDVVHVSNWNVLVRSLIAARTSEPRSRRRDR